MKRFLPSTFARGLFYLLVFVFIINALLTTILPASGLLYLKSWYSDQGEQYQLELEDWNLSLITGELRFDNLQLSHPGPSSDLKATRLERVDINLNVLALFSRQLHIEQIEISGIDFGAVLKEAVEKKKLSLAGLTIPLTTSATPANAESLEKEMLEKEMLEKESSKSETANEAWRMRLDKLLLTDHRYQFSQQGMKAGLEIQQILLTDLSTDNSGDVPLQIEVQLSELNLETPDVVTLNQPLKLSWQGAVSSLWQDPVLKGDLVISGIDMKAAQAPRFTLQKLMLQGVDASAAVQSVEELIIENIALGDDQEATLFALEKYQVDDIRVNPIHKEGLMLNTGLHTYQGLIAQLVKQSNGLLAGLPVSAEEERAGSVEPEESVSAEAAEEQMAQDEKQISFSIVGLRQQGPPGSSYIHFDDQSVQPQGKVRLAIEKIEIGAIDSNQLAQGSSIQMQFALDEYNQIAVDGQLGLLNGQPEGQMNLTVKQLNLVPFNGYTANAMGYHVQKGALKLDVQLAIRNAEMNGEADILLRNSELLPVDKATIDRLGKQISMPVDTVLSILRDDNNNIRLTMPLTGNINDPDVGLDDLINQLSLLALKEAATYYLKQSLQPYGALITLSSYAGKYLMAIRLDDLKYEPLITEVSETQALYLEKVAAMMKEKEELELQVCGFASEGESKTLDKTNTWQQLALKRSGNIKAWFKNKHNGLLPRVTTCQPQKGEDAIVSMGF